VSGSEDFVVPGRNGWLFEVSDVPALAAALREAKNLPPGGLAAMGRQARADVEATASLDIVVAKLQSLYAGARPCDLSVALAADLSSTPSSTTLPPAEAKHS
jgi:glycosyltransferase involved in cell wall biosynthesis